MVVQDTRHSRGSDRGRWSEEGGGQDGRLSRGLGWLSIGIGLAEVAAPDRVARMIGVPDDDTNRRTLRAFGLREIANGVGILARPGEAGWMWGRVGGDVMDLAFLAGNLRSEEARPTRIAAAAAAVAGIAALDVLCSQRLGQPADGAVHLPWRRDIHVRQSVTINRPAAEIHAFWRDFRNLPRFMNHLERVEPLDGDGRRSRWTAKAPAGGTVSWDAEITDERPGERIAWRSLEGADVDNRGEVRFDAAPGGRGTVLRVEMLYSPPGGAVVSLAARLFGEEPQTQMREDLRRLKQVLETGEVTVAEGSLALTHPAQPLPAGDGVRRAEGGRP